MVVDISTPFAVELARALAAEHPPVTLEVTDELQLSTPATILWASLGLPRLTRLQYAIVATVQRYELARDARRHAEAARALANLDTLGTSWTELIELVERSKSS